VTLPNPVIAASGTFGYGTELAGVVDLSALGAISVKGLSLAKSHPFATELHDIGFELHAGEVLGVAGVSGNGQQELLAALSGEDPRAAHDAIKLDGRPVGRFNAARRRDLGLG